MKYAEVEFCNNCGSSDIILIKTADDTTNETIMANEEVKEKFDNFCGETCADSLGYDCDACEWVSWEEEDAYYADCSMEVRPISKEIFKNYEPYFTVVEV